jgi:asparagine N-glycosylation enzyme membrane subunit Stt3
MSESKARPGLAWRRAGVALTLLAMAALAFAARVVPTWDDVFQDDGGVHLYGVDPYFHLRHATSAAKHFPTLLRRDAATHFPLGQHSDAAGGFDLAIAAASLAIAGEFDPATVERVAAWTPPVLFLLAFAGLFAWARRSLGEGPALFACAMLALYPGSLIQRSLLGFADHHVAEVALAAWIAWGLTRAVDRAEREAERWHDTWPAVLAMVALVFTWLGAPVTWLLTALALLFAMLLETVQDRDPRPLARVGARHGAAGVGIAIAIAWLDPNLVLEPKLFARFALAGLAYFPGLPIAARALVWLRMRTGSAAIAGFVGTGAAIAASVALLVDPALDGMFRRLLEPGRAVRRRC